MNEMSKLTIADDPKARETEPQRANPAILPTIILRTQDVDDGRSLAALLAAD